MVMKITYNNMVNNEHTNKGKEPVTEQLMLSSVLLVL